MLWALLSPWWIKQLTEMLSLRWTTFTRENTVRVKRYILLFFLHKKNTDIIILSKALFCLSVCFCFCFHISVMQNTGDTFFSKAHIFACVCLIVCFISSNVSSVSWLFWIRERFCSSSSAKMSSSWWGSLKNSSSSCTACCTQLWQNCRWQLQTFGTRHGLMP